MWFDVNKALVEVLEQPPATPAPMPAAAKAPKRLSDNPSVIAGEIMDTLRGCNSLAQASAALQRFKAEISYLETADPVRKIHIENYVRHMWAGTFSLHGDDRRAGAK